MSAPLSQSLHQSPPGLPVRGDGLLQLPEQHMERRVDAFAIEWHIRSVIKEGPDWYGACTCGFFTTSCLTADEAHRRPCEVEDTLLASRERERRVLARASH